MLRNSRWVPAALACKATVIIIHTGRLETTPGLTSQAPVLQSSFLPLLITLVVPLARVGGRASPRAHSCWETWANQGSSGRSPFLAFIFR